MGAKEDNPKTPDTVGNDRNVQDSFAIRIAGRLDARWATWFDGLSVTNEDDGTTTIQGPVADQAALHGLLQKVRDLGLELVSVTRLQSQTRN